MERKIFFFNDIYLYDWSEGKWETPKIILNGVEIVPYRGHHVGITYGEKEVYFFGGEYNRERNNDIIKMEWIDRKF